MTISKINVNGQVYDVVDKSFEEKEEVISAALNDINSRIEEKEETISAALNDLNTRIVENEEVISASLNDLNQRISNGGSSLALATVAMSGSYNDLSNKPTIPAEQIQSDWNLTNTSSKDYIKNKPDLDKINLSILSILDVLGMPSPEDYVDLGLPSGLLWSKYNIDATLPDGFTASEYQYECSFFSWGNTEAHNPVSGTAFGYNWGSSNDGPYASTPGAEITYPGSADLSHDAARANCGASWRLPTTEEFAELFANVDFVQADGETVISESLKDKRVTVNNIVGIYLKSKINGKLLFFPCTGSGGGATWGNWGLYGAYWSSSLYSATNGLYLIFTSGVINPQSSSSNRFVGLAVRPVTEQSVITSLNKRITALENNNSN